MFFKFLLFSILFCAQSFCSLEVLPPKQLNSWGTSAEIYADLKKALAEKPATIAKANKTTIEIIQSQLNQNEELKRSFEDYRKENPIYYLHECTSCPLARSKSEARAQYEKALIDKALELKKVKKGSLNFTSFASGGLFQDLLILMQLIEKGVTEINYHSIDIGRTLYLLIMQDRKQICAFDPFPSFQELEKMATQNIMAARFVQQFDKTDILKSHHEIVSQFVHWISYQYPKAKIKFFFHADVNRYIEYCDKNLQMIPDIIGACDIADFRPFSNEREKQEMLRPYYIANQNLRILMRYSTWHNPNVHSFLLDIVGALYHNHDTQANRIANVRGCCLKISSIWKSNLGKAALGVLLVGGYIAVNKLKEMFG